MSNQTYGKIWYADTAGIITRDPIIIRKILFRPNAHSDAALFHYWLDSLKEGTSGTIFGTAVTGTITNTTTLTMSDGTYLPSSIADGDFIALTYSDGDLDNYWRKAGNKKKVQLVATAGNNTVVVIHAVPDGWDNEAGKKYTWEVFTGLKAFAFLSQATNAKMEQIDFGPSGFELPNLALETISTSAYCLIYLA